ncbi:MAG: MOSC domain-containing protein [Pseudomonadota bacterium]
MSLEPTIVSVCIGQPAPLVSKPTVLSGIVKRPVAGPIEVGYANLAGDGQADLSVHGGRDKAVYVYSNDHYPHWRDVLGHELAPAQFGENLTVSGMREADVIIGARYRVGSAIVVVAQPRLPCFKLGIHLSDERFPGQFLQSGRLGFYLRVEQVGVLEVGDRFELLEAPADGFSITRLWQLAFIEPCEGENCMLTQRALTELLYLDEGWQRRLRGKLRSGNCAPEEIAL